MKEMNEGLIIANFVQFDMDWGHRNDIKGFEKGLIEIDQGIEKVLRETRNGDLLFITADHGNDPTTPSTDHSREYIPILAYTTKEIGENLDARQSFADLGKTIARYFGIEGLENGEDFLNACIF